MRGSPPTNRMTRMAGLILAEAALHYSHPYGRPVIGWLSEISTMTRAQAIDFYEHHYAPNNAVLIVAGGAGEPLRHYGTVGIMAAVMTIASLGLAKRIGSQRVVGPVDPLDPIDPVAVD